LLLVVVANYLVPEKAFTWVTSIALIGNAVDLGNHHGGARQVPQCGRRRPRGAGAVSDAGRAVRELGGGSRFYWR